MTLNEYQEQAAQTAIVLNGIKEKYPDLPEEIYNMLERDYAGLGLGEAGEVQGKLKKLIRDKQGVCSEEDKKEIGKELGDLLWYVAFCCKVLGIQLDDVASENIAKLQSRKQRGVLSGNGDNR